MYQHQEITPSMTVTTMSMHCSTVNYNRIIIMQATISYRRRT